MASTTAPVGAAKILLVDDRPENLLALEAILGGCGYTLIRAQSGEAALEAVLRHEFALLLVDVAMPGMDGFETATLVRSRPRCANTPIIFVTASSYDPAQVHFGYEVGAVDYLYKPVSAALVRAKVAVFVDLHRQREMLRRRGEQLAEKGLREREMLAMRAAAALHQSEAQYDTTARQAHFGMAIIEADGTWRRANAALRLGLGYRVQQLPRLPALLHPRVRYDAAALDATLCGRSQRFRDELPLRHASGRLVWMRASVSWIQAGPEGSLAAVLEDVTVAHRVAAFEHFLQAASCALLAELDCRATLRQVARLAVEGIADWCAVDVVEADGRRLACLEVAHADPAGAAGARALRERVAWLQVQDPTTAAQPVPQLYAELTDADLAARGVEVGSLGALADRLPCSLLRVPMVAHGNTLGAITLASERPWQRFIAAELRLAEDLAHRCALAIENARLYEEAQQAIAARDEFLSVASHELRTPLTPLRLQLQRLIGTPRRPPAKLSRERTYEILRRSERHVQRLAGLIDNLLDVSRITAGRLRLEVEAVELGRLTREVVGRFSDEIEHAGAQLTLTATASIVGQWDRGRLGQVIGNLLTNAIKYGNGGPIELGLSEHLGRARLCVRDFGIGITADKLEAIFGRFERAVSARAYGGLGLGLFIARQIVDAHGGSIAVDSRAGEGALFTVELPCDGAAASSPFVRDPGRGTGILPG